MTIKIGDQIPEVILKRIRDGVETVDTRALFDGRKAVLFAVPGAFTPTCSEKHLPSFVEHFDDLAAGTSGCPRGCGHDEPDCALDAWVAQGRAGEAGESRLVSLRRLLGAGERPGESREDKELGVQ